MWLIHSSGIWIVSRGVSDSFLSTKPPKMGGRWGAYLEDRDHYILLLSPSEIYHMEFYLMSLCLKHCFPLHKLQVAHDVYELLELSLWYLVF